MTPPRAASVIDHARLFALSTWHTRPHQLLSRLRLDVQRRSRRCVAAVTGRAPAAAGVPLATTPFAPAAIFAPRLDGVVQGATGATVRLAHREWPLTVPQEWQPAELGVRLEALHLHSMEYLEGVDDRLFEAVVRDWIDANPPYGAKYWLGGWNGYALSIRVVVWMQQFAGRRARLSADFTRRLLLSLEQQLHFLTRHLEVDIGGNHLVRNARALLWAGRFFHGAVAAGWQRLGEQLLTRELDEQVLADGFHFELSPAYHLQVFADFLECLHVLPPGAARDRLAAVLPDMAQVVADMTHGDGFVSQFNDGWMHMTYSPAACLAVYERLLAHRVEARRLFAFRSAGYFGARQEGQLVIVDAGRVGPDHLPAHAHGDIFGFEWSLAGRRLIVDAGVSEYRPGAWRAYARSTAAHNTVTVGGQDQCEFWRSFRVASRASVTRRYHRETADGFILEASHDGYRRLAGAPIHTRRFDASPRRITVSDRVAAGAGQPVRAHLLLHPDVQVERVADGARLTDGATLVVLRTRHAVSAERGWWSPEFNLRIPTTQLTIDYGMAPCAGGFSLCAERVAPTPGTTP